MVLEDFDSSDAFHDRSSDTQKESTFDRHGRRTSMTMTGILNALDGLNQLDKQIIFMTTNHIDKIDPAILRPGRVDHLVEVPPVQMKVAAKHLLQLYPDLHGNSAVDRWISSDACIPGCELTRIKLAAKTNVLIVAKLMRELIDNKESIVEPDKGAA